MPNINILSPHIADLIAAGEVVERPASVVKELIENSIDAKAHNITVEIKNGGMSYIKISDDGIGMSPEDVGICTLRHATSKIANERDLECIGTLGFRGEALAAISAVSKMEITTRAIGDELGTHMCFEASDIMSMENLGCPSGTVMTVSSLFYNTPARLKFMKTDRAETSACVSVAQKCALAHPEVSIRFISDGKEHFFTAGDNRLSSVSYSILGREIGADMKPCNYEDEGVKITGYTCAPHNCRGNRAMQFFFVNGRNIRSLSLQTAVENAYKNTSMVGKYPACVLHINVNLSGVDVNVHPTKAEVRFSDEKRIFSAVYCAVLSALEGKKEPEIVVEPPKIKAPEPERKRTLYPLDVPKDATYRILSADEYKDLFIGDGYVPSKPYVINPPKKYPLNDIIKQPEKVEAPQPKPEPKTLPKPLPEYRIIGETMATYIMVECENELIFIDKHAAHERSIFDNLKKNGTKMMSQGLIEPIVFRINSADEEDFARLCDLGFEIEPFGNTDAIIRAIPSIISPDEAVSTVEELLQNPQQSDKLDHILHTMACKAAIKAGKNSEISELDVLVKKVLSGEVKYCPHGRAVMFKMSKYELDKRCNRV